MMKERRLFYMRKKWLTAAVIGLCGLTLAACQNQTDSSKNEQTATSETAKVVDFKSLTLPQLSEEVAEDEALVAMETSMGTIKIKLFPKYAPKTVENFVTHAKEGYYDGLIFHRVIDNFMIQGGDPKGTGTGGESIWGEPFEDELNHELYNLRGALSMANSGPDTNGSQFFIVQNHDDQSDGLLTDEYPQAIIDAYKNGGAFYLDYAFEGSPSSHTVFGQVIEGMDVVDKIAETETDAKTDRPVEDVTIKKIEILKDIPKK